MVLNTHTQTHTHFEPFENTTGKNIFRSMRRPKVHMRSPRLRQIRMWGLTPLIRGEAGWTWTRGRKPQKTGVLAGYGREEERTQSHSHTQRNFLEVLRFQKRCEGLTQLAKKEVERVLLSRRMWGSWEGRVTRSWQGCNLKFGPGHGDLLCTPGRIQGVQRTNVGLSKPPPPHPTKNTNSFLWR